MKVRLLAGLLAIYVCCMTACSSSNNNGTVTSSGTAALYLATAGDTSLAAYTVSLSNGGLNVLGNTVTTGGAPAAIALSPSLTTLFVSNSASNSISSFAINSDGSLNASAGSTPAGTTPTGMATDPNGKFLFVANQGSNNVSVFSINNTSLTKVAGSPFTTIPTGQTAPTGPVAVAVSASGNFLYVANQFAGNISVFSISSTGALTPLGTSPYAAGLDPSGLSITPGGAFLYVANSGSNNVSAFFICDKVVTSCAVASKPDGTLSPVAGSPFSAGQGPVAVVADPFFPFLYVLDKQSFQISGYSYGAGSGVLTPLTTSPVSTGTTPVSFVIISGATGTNAGNTTTNTTDYVYVANNGASTLSAFTLNTTTGALTPLGQPTTTTTNPSAVAAN